MAIFVRRKLIARSDRYTPWPVGGYSRSLKLASSQPSARATV